MTKPEQLTFPWSKPNKAIFNHFYLEDINLYVKDALLKHDDLFLYGIHGTGKSFLLQALCNEYTLNKKTSLYRQSRYLLMLCVYELQWGNKS